MTNIDREPCCWLTASALCVVNKVLLFKHVHAWIFSFPSLIASESLGSVLGTVQSEKDQQMPDAWSTVHSLVWMPPLSGGTVAGGCFSADTTLSLLLFQAKMRSKTQNKCDVPAASDGWGGGRGYVLFNHRPFMIWTVDPAETHSYYWDRDETLSVHYIVSENIIFYKARTVSGKWSHK